MKITLRLVPAFCLALAACHASAAPVNLIDPTTLLGTQVVTFDDVPGGVGAGTNYNGVLVSGGVSFAERFAGQALSASGGFDVLSGVPTGTLTLQNGLTNANLSVFVNGVTQVMAGLGPLGFPDAGAVGEGAFATLFSNGQSEFGFDLVGGQGGSAFVSFFRSDGALIDTVVLSDLADRSYAFRREGNLTDIAGISVYNNDPGGIAIDNVRFNIPNGGGGTTPEPGSLALVALALLGAAAVRRAV